MGFDLYASLFYGFVTEGIPWQDAQDCVPREWPEQRYTRRLKEMSPAVTTDSPCNIGCIFSEQYGEAVPHWVYVLASQSTGADSGATRVKSVEIDPKWREQLLSYCEIMGIPWQEPSWCLGTRIN